MRCLKCKKTFKKNLDKCPFCNTKVELDVSSNDDFKEHIELLEKMEKTLSDTKEFKITKNKKRDDGEVSLDETVAINVLNDNNTSLLDEINKQIDTINSEALEEQNKVDENIKSMLVEEELASLESFKKRRKVLVVTGIASLSLIALMIVLFIISSTLTANKTSSTIDYEKMVINSLDTYYQTSEIDDLIYVMENGKNSEHKLAYLQTTVKNTCYDWVDSYSEEEANSSKEYEDITYKYRELIDGLYRYALVKKDDQYIRALSEIDYDEIILEFENIYNNSLEFYDGLDLFNAKDYNKAYYMFGKIDKENSYYDKSVTYIDKIYENIIILLNKDISKIENDIDTLSDSEKLSVYILIEETILEYDNVYDVNLSENLEYQSLLSKYSSKVSEYTDLVY